MSLARRPTRAADAATPGLAARAGALALLTAVLEQGQSLSEQTATEGPLAALSPPERARAQGLATSTLRHLGRIDAILDGFLAKPPPLAARNALRLAVAEMHLDGVPAHAAVDGAVRLARGSSGARHLSGLVNAVARRVADGGAELWDTATDDLPPAWLATPLRKAYGREGLAAIAAAHLASPPLDITPRDPASAEDLAQTLGAELLPTGSLRLAGRAQVSALPGFEEGAWWVQDAAAALPARVLGDVKGQNVLDLCAAPGGKTLQLAAAGARVTALDASASRLARLAENLARTRLEAEVVVADARDWTPPEQFDAILLDAPCSATGTLRRHPDLPFVRSGAEIPALIALQSTLLDRAWTMLAPGGRLVFCTCSLLPGEGEQQVSRFLARTKGARLAPAEATGVPADWRDEAGGLRTRPDFWPELGGLDGFYIARLEKAV